MCVCKTNGFMCILYVAVALLSVTLLIHMCGTVYWDRVSAGEG